MDGGVGLLLCGDGKGNFNSVWPDDSGLLIRGDMKGATVCDLNDDGWADILVTRNNDSILAFQNQSPSISGSGHPLAVRLIGRTPNPLAIGARVTLVRNDGSSQAAEIHAGSGYLSQSIATLFFGRGQDRDGQELIIRWPDGKTTRHALDKDVSNLQIKQS
jgi:enediyne biosynthesis protein E4